MVAANPPRLKILFFWSAHLHFNNSIISVLFFKQEMCFNWYVAVLCSSCKVNRKRRLVQPESKQQSKGEYSLTAFLFLLY